MSTLTAAGAAINNSLIRTVLTHRATVYGRAVSGGQFTTVLQSGLACRLEPLSRQPAATATTRRELAAMASFRWDATVDLPETGIQIEVDAFPGQRWNLTNATAWPDDVPGIGIVSKSADLTRAT